MFVRAYTQKATGTWREAHASAVFESHVCHTGLSLHFQTLHSRPMCQKLKKLRNFFGCSLTVAPVNTSCLSEPPASLNPSVTELIPPVPTWFGRGWHLDSGKGTWIRGMEPKKPGAGWTKTSNPCEKKTDSVAELEGIVVSDFLSSEAVSLSV